MFYQIVIHHYDRLLCENQLRLHYGIHILPDDELAVKSVSLIVLYSMFQTLHCTDEIPGLGYFHRQIECPKVLRRL